VTRGSGFLGRFRETAPFGHGSEEGGCAFGGSAMPNRHA
jgi:hypothetical protein